MEHAMFLVGVDGCAVEGAGAGGWWGDRELPTSRSAGLLRGLKCRPGGGGFFFGAAAVVEQEKVNVVRAAM